ncbi:MAG: cellulase family glycosylhydrolase [Clostridia bacterium]|nr:cellulase family glycosylhydrolase [Clostridia bacterium]
MPYYGFNFLWMYAKGDWNPEPKEADTDELDFIAEEGFNFVRIPTDYHFWTHDFDYFSPDERIIEYFDRYIEACNSRGLHVSLNIHRAPGYCINWPEREKHNLWRDREAQDGFAFIWQYLAKRYKGIPSSKLSFDLVNEPANIPPTHPCTRDDHQKVIRRTIAAVREADPERQIVIDGFDGGGSALPELADLGSQNVIHSGRGYEPFMLTHYQAEWVRGSIDWRVPDYPGGEECRQKLREYYKPWREVQAAGVPVHIGEFGCYNKLPNDLALRWFEDVLSVFREFGWGYSLWNFRGSFGIVEHGRPGTVYEDCRGMKVDRKMLDIFKASRV